MGIGIVKATTPSYMEEEKYSITGEKANIFLT